MRVSLCTQHPQLTISESQTYAICCRRWHRPATRTPHASIRTPRDANSTRTEGFAYVEADGSRSTASWEGIWGGDTSAIHCVWLIDVEMSFCRIVQSANEIEAKIVASRNRTGVSSETVAVGVAKSTTIRTDHYTIATWHGRWKFHYLKSHVCFTFPKMWLAGIEPASHRRLSRLASPNPQRYVLTTIL